MNKDSLLPAAVGLPKPIVPKSSMVVDDSLERCDNYEQHESLQKLYYNAVQCLVKYDATIISLRQEVESKNEHIAFLEAKLVQTSFELASSKALQDEQLQELQQLKRRLSSFETFGGSEEEAASIPPPIRQIKFMQDQLRKQDPEVSNKTAAAPPAVHSMEVSREAVPPVTDPFAPPAVQSMEASRASVPPVTNHFTVTQQLLCTQGRCVSPAPRSRLRDSVPTDICCEDHDDSVSAIFDILDLLAETETDNDRNTSCRSDDVDSPDDDKDNVSAARGMFTTFRVQAKKPSSTETMMRSFSSAPDNKKSSRQPATRNYSWKAHLDDAASKRLADLKQYLRGDRYDDQGS